MTHFVVCSWKNASPEETQSRRYLHSRFTTLPHDCSTCVLVSSQARPRNDCPLLSLSRARALSLSIYLFISINISSEGRKGGSPFLGRPQPDSQTFPTSAQATRACTSRSLLSLACTPTRPTPSAVEADASVSVVSVSTKKLEPVMCWGADTSGWERGGHSIFWVLHGTKYR